MENFVVSREVRISSALQTLATALCLRDLNRPCIYDTNSNYAKLLHTVKEKLEALDDDKLNFVASKVKDLKIVILTSNMSIEEVFSVDHNTVSLFATYGYRHLLKQPRFAPIELIAIHFALTLRIGRHDSIVTIYEEMLNRLHAFTAEQIDMISGKLKDINDLMCRSGCHIDAAFSEATRKSVFDVLDKTNDNTYNLFLNEIPQEFHPIVSYEPSVVSIVYHLKTIFEHEIKKANHYSLSDCELIAMFDKYTNDISSLNRFLEWKNEIVTLIRSSDTFIGKILDFVAERNNNCHLCRIRSTNCIASLKHTLPETIRIVDNPSREYILTLLTTEFTVASFNNYDHFSRRYESFCIKFDEVRDLLNNKLLTDAALNRLHKLSKGICVFIKVMNVSLDMALSYAFNEANSSFFMEIKDYEHCHADDIRIKMPFEL